MNATSPSIPAHNSRQSSAQSAVQCRARTASELPLNPPPAWLRRGFQWYVRRYLAKHFHSLSVLNGPAEYDPSIPLVVYANHASWWDPLVAVFLSSEYFPDRAMFAPIDAAALERYRVLGKLGFIGVDPANPRSLAQFRQTTRRVLSTPGASLWVTPEGRFCDPRDAEAPFQPGLAHIVAGMPPGRVLPLAAEYVFWEERRPEILVNFGTPFAIEVDSHRDRAVWNAELSAALRQTQRELADAVIRRDAAAFHVKLRGRAGLGGVYDVCRRAVAWARGEQFDMHHGEKLQ